ncbi:MAG: conjugal transfer protein TrbI [Sphingomonadales bacterium 32-68-7]|nr:MAG: conjugal transfer protein TrbI [Sphingomonadales bacterium 12-68-11]OYX10404.1 MAG: conjugal transfer protein TrbI [Sphingomonadales bacterium 32-68-7]
MTEPAAPDLAPAAPKEDPETLVLRGRPRPVVRFRRGVIIGGTAAMAAALAVVAWLALAPQGLRLAAGQAEEVMPANAQMPEALAGAPRSYGEVPQLGPPLPGDLGRPILEHQRSLEGQASEPFAAPPADPAREAAEAERQRRIAERQAARTSAVIVQISGGRTAIVSSGDASGNPVPGPPPPPAAGDGAPTGPPRAEASSLRAAPSVWTLSAGAVIPASLITGVNSDLPGTVLAQVTENVRDSATGRTVLVPQGARLIGSYDSVVAFGQSRALLVWQRIVLPDGSSIALDNMPATDLEGYAGVRDGVDFHTWRLLKGIGLSTLLSVGTEIGLGDDEGDLVRAVRESAQQNAARAGEQITARNLDIRPTITVRPGWPVRAIVNKDLVLQPWRP